MHGWDWGIFKAINGWSDRWLPFLGFFTDATKLTWVRIVLALMIVGMILARGKARKTILLSLVAWPLANLLTDLLKNGFKMPRPFQQFPDEVILRAGASDSFGTASAHSANMAAIAFVFVYYLRHWGIPWTLIALLTGISRIYVGVHYPYQVLLGWTCGIFAGAFVCLLYDFLTRKRTPEEVNSGHAEQTDDRRSRCAK